MSLFRLDGETNACRLKKRDVSFLVTLVTWWNWHGFEIWHFDGRIIFCFFGVLRFRPGADKAIFSGSLINFSTHSQISRAAWCESKLKPITLRWSGFWGWKKLKFIFVNKKVRIYLKTSTLCGMLLRSVYSWISYRWYPARVRNMFHVQLTQTLP